MIINRSITLSVTVLFLIPSTISWSLKSRLSQFVHSSLIHSSILFQNRRTFGHWKSRCTMVSSSLHPNVQKGLFLIFLMCKNRFVGISLLIVLNWNHFSWESLVVLTAFVKTFFQLICSLKVSSHFSVAGGLLVVCTNNL